MQETDRRNEELEQEIINKMPSGIGIFDVTGSVIEQKYLNDGFYQMINARREDRKQFFAKGTVNPVHPDDRKGLMEEVKASIKEHRIFEYQFRNLDGHGQYLWLGIRASHYPLNEETERFYASYYNVDAFISERNQFAEDSKYLNSILGQIPGGVAVFTEKNGIIELIYTNESFYILHHRSRTNHAGQSKNPLDWITPEDRTLFWDEFQRVTSGEKKIGRISYRIIGDDHMPHWVQTQFSRAEQRDGIQYYYASIVNEDERVAAQQQILQNKLMYDEAARAAKLIIWSYDLQNHQAVMMQSGYTAEICQKLGVPPVIDHVVENILPYVDPGDQQSFRNAYREMENGAETASCEFHFQMPGHSSKQLEKIMMRRITDQKGHLVNIFCIGQNISDERSMESDYEQTFRQLEQAYPHSLGSFHLNLTKNWCGDGRSPLAFVMKQQSAGTVDGYFQEFAKLIADEEIKKDFFARFDRELLLKQFAEGIKQVSIEYPIVYAEGKRHWREGLLFMLRNPRTNDIEAVTYAVDIDERKKNEFIMNKLIHDHFDYVGIIHPSDQTFEFCSRRPWITYGKIGEVFPYEQCCQYIDAQFTDDHERRIFDELIAIPSIKHEMDEKGTRSVSYLKTVDGKTSCTKLRYSWLEKEGGDILVVRTDVTDAYEKEQQQIKLLEDEKKEAEAANIAKSEFLSRMSHDIRTPLNGIIGMTYLAQKQANPERTQDCLTKIDTSSKFLLSLINDVLDMAKAESGRIELHPEPYSKEEFGAYINAIIVPLCQERSQSFSFEPVTMLEDVVPLFDKLSINQVVFNLFSNAVKYTPEGGSICYRVVERKLSESQMTMQVDIIDNGIGMSKEFQKRLFEPFSQENRSDDPEMRGTGLGLAITKRLMDAMGGKISVTSEIGKGTTFRLDFLLSCVPVQQQKEQPKAGPVIDLAGRHILICEDHPLNQQIAKEILEEKQIHVTAASDGQEGVKAFANSSIDYFDCILMDIHMPIMDGYEATRKIRTLNRPDASSVKIIAMTADAFADDIKKCMDAGMNSHIAKPIDPGRLYQVLSQALAKQ